MSEDRLHRLLAELREAGVEAEVCDHLARYLVAVEAADPTAIAHADFVVVALAEALLTSLRTSSKP